MRLVHDLDTFAALPTDAQERVTRRTKAFRSVMGPTSWRSPGEASRTATQEYGLYFVAFSADQSRYDLMLGMAGDGLPDRLTDFSRSIGAASTSPHA